MSKTIKIFCFALLIHTTVFAKDYTLLSPDKKNHDKNIGREKYHLVGTERSGVTA